MQLFFDNRSTVVSAAELDKAERAIDAVSLVFATAWGLRAPCFVDSAAVLASGDCRVVIVDDDPSKAGEYGDHDEENGMPVACVLAKIVTDGGGGVLDGGQIGISVASVICHEVFEALVDPMINDWAFDGRLFRAKEAADPVEQVGFTSILEDGTEVLVSDGVLPRYFDAQAPAASDFDLARVVTAPFQLTAGGYQIILDPATGQQTEVFGDKRHPVLEKLRQHRFARRARRRRRMQEIAEITR
jgi:hypothetical protein